MNRTTIKRLLVAKVRSARVNRRCRGAVGQHHLAEGRTHHHRHGSLAQRHAVAVEVRVADLPAQCGHPQANVDNDNAEPNRRLSPNGTSPCTPTAPSSPPASARSPPAPCCCLQPQPARPAPCTGRRCRASPSPPRSIRSDPGSSWDRRGNRLVQDLPPTRRRRQWHSRAQDDTPDSQPDMIAQPEIAWLATAGSRHGRIEQARIIRPVNPAFTAPVTSPTTAPATPPTPQGEQSR